MNHQFVSKDKRESSHPAPTQQYYKLQILAPLKQALDAGNTIEIFNSLKTNGDTAQISYLKKEDTWVIASKNVTLLANSIEQVREHYPEESRYYMARLIAECWFNKLAKMSQEKRQKIKRDLGRMNTTLVGEFVGHPELETMIHYPVETILFHSIVDNSQSEHFWCHPNSQRTLKQFGLDTVP